MAHSACCRSLAAWLDPWENWPHKTFGVQPCWEKSGFNHHQGSIYCPPANRLHINTQSHVSLFWLLEAVLLTQDGFKLTILLTCHPRYWDYKRVPLHQFTTLLLTVGKLGAFLPLLPNQIRRSLSSDRMKQVCITVHHWKWRFTLPSPKWASWQQGQIMLSLATAL